MASNGKAVTGTAVMARSANEEKKNHCISFCAYDFTGFSFFEGGANLAILDKVFEPKSVFGMKVIKFFKAHRSVTMLESM